MTYFMITAAKKFARLFQLGWTSALEDELIFAGHDLFVESAVFYLRWIENSGSRMLDRECWIENGAVA